MNRITHLFVLFLFMLFVPHGVSAQTPALISSTGTAAVSLEAVPTNGNAFSYNTLSITNSRVDLSADGANLEFETHLRNDSPYDKSHRLGIEFHQVPKDDPWGPSSPYLVLPLSGEYRVPANTVLPVRFSVPAPRVPKGKYRVFIGGSGDTGQLAAKMYVRDIELNGGELFTLSSCRVSGRSIDTGGVIFSENEDPNPFHFSCIVTSKQQEEANVTLSLRIRDDEYEEREMARVNGKATKSGTEIFGTSSQVLSPGYYRLDILPVDNTGDPLGASASSLVVYSGVSGKIFDISELNASYNKGDVAPISVQTAHWGQMQHVLHIELSSGGVKCADDLRLTPERSPAPSSGKFSIKRDCVSPVITVTLYSPDGKELDRVVRSYAQQLTPREVSVPDALRLLAVLLFLLIAPFLIRWMKNEGRKNVPPIAVALFFFGALLGGISPENARATDFNFRCGHYDFFSTCGGFLIDTFTVRATISSPVFLTPNEFSVGTYTVTPTFGWVPGGWASVHFTDTGTMPILDVPITWPQASVSVPFGWNAPAVAGMYQAGATNPTANGTLFAFPPHPPCVVNNFSVCWPIPLEGAFHTHNYFVGAPACGDFMCNGGETCGTCPGDCGACAPVCGDAMCNGAETCGTCPGDCGACAPVCGDAMCNGGETCGTCPGDCGACAPFCGDFMCNGGETCGTCPGDCGACAPPPPVFTTPLSGVTPVAYNTPTQLTWTANPATSCTLYQNGAATGAVPATAVNYITAPLTIDSTFRIDCVNGTSPTTQSNTITVRVRPRVTATINGGASVTRLPSESFTIVMSSDNAGSCQWRRSFDGSYLGPNGWDYPTSLGATSYNSGPLMWALIDGASDLYTWTFRCFNPNDVTIFTDSTPITLTLNAPAPVASVVPITPPPQAFSAYLGTTKLIIPTFTMTNTGDIGSTVNLVSVTPDAPAPGLEYWCQLGCSATLAQGAPMHSVTIAFRPAGIGLRPVQNFTFNFNGIPPQVVSVQGTGLDPFVPAAESFIKIPVASTSYSTLFIDNNATDPIDVGYLNGMVSPFGCVNASDCTTGPLIIPPGGMDVPIKFTPTSAQYFIIHPTLFNFPLVPITIDGYGSPKVKYCDPGTPGCTL